MITTPPAGVIATAYLRYSCDNSDPTSLDQQLTNVLERAHRDGVFIPWHLVFADAAVTGTTAKRRGYELAQQALFGGDAAIFYVDELSRATRSQTETLRLFKRVVRERKRLIAVSGGIDTNDESIKLRVSFEAMVNELNVDHIKKRVRRGMRSAFERGRVVNYAGFGYRQIPVLNSDGTPVTKPNGRIDQETVIDEVQATIVRRIYTDYAGGLLSPAEIARDLNRERAADSLCWDASTVHGLLERKRFRGRFDYNQTETVYDEETGKKTAVPRPESEWMRRDEPDMRIIDEELAGRVDRLLAARKRGPYQKGQRVDEHYPRRLFDLVCGVCGKHLRLDRGGKYSVVCCPDGVMAKRGCTLAGSKSVRAIDEAMTRHILATVADEAFVDRVVEETRRAFAELAAQPAVDSAPILAEVAEIKKRIAALTKTLESVGPETVEVIARQLDAAHKGLRERQAEADRATRPPGPPPAPPTREQVVATFTKIPELLREDVRRAASVLRVLTGPVSVTQEPRPGQKKVAWFGSFRLDGTAMYLELTRNGSNPSPGTSGSRLPRTWKEASQIVISLCERTPTASFLAELTAASHVGGAKGYLVQRYGLREQAAALILSLLGFMPEDEGDGPNVAPFPPVPAREKGKFAMPWISFLRDRVGLIPRLAREVLRRQLAIEISLPTVDRLYRTVPAVTDVASQGDASPLPPRAA